jgi:hypothetical protein
LLGKLLLLALELIEELATLVELDLTDQVDKSSADDLAVECLEKLRFKHVPHRKLLSR